MSLIYILTNEENGRKFVGKSSLPKDLLVDLLYNILNNGEHYNELLQRDWNEHPFSIKLENHVECSKKCDEYINDWQLLNPQFGYNVFQDLKNNRGRMRRDEIFSEDVCLLYTLIPYIQTWIPVFRVERNTLVNRLSNYDVMRSNYYSCTISNYTEYYWTALRMMYLDNRCMLSSQIIGAMENKYDISHQLRITPRKISKFFISNGVRKSDRIQNGCSVFCPTKV